MSVSHMRCEPSSRQVDELLDERLAHRGRAGETQPIDNIAIRIAKSRWWKNAEKRI
jgi:hypothetical protein